jgi:hypothetical protein
MPLELIFCNLFAMFGFTQVEMRGIQKQKELKVPAMILSSC